MRYQTIFIILVIGFSLKSCDFKKPEKSSSFDADFTHWDREIYDGLSSCDSDNGMIRSQGRHHYKEVIEGRFHKRIFEEFLKQIDSRTDSHLVFHDIFDVGSYMWKHNIVVYGDSVKYSYYFKDDSLHSKKSSLDTEFVWHQNATGNEDKSVYCCDSCQYNKFLLIESHLKLKPESLILNSASFHGGYSASNRVHPQIWGRTIPIEIR